MARTKKSEKKKLKQKVCNTSKSKQQKMRNKYYIVKEGKNPHCAIQNDEEEYDSRNPWMSETESDASTPWISVPEEKQNGEDVSESNEEEESDSSDLWMSWISEATDVDEMRARYARWCKMKRWTYLYRQYLENKQVHTERLRKVLVEHWKETHAIPGDGDCFFNSVCHQVRFTNPDLDAIKLREIVCEHLKEQKEEYCGYIHLEDDEAFEDKIDKELKPSGQWKSDLGDLLPSCIANIFQCHVEIYSSRESTPYHKFKPSISKSTLHHSSTIQLAYTAIEGSEHYDSCIDFSEDEYIKAYLDDCDYEEEEFTNNYIDDEFIDLFADNYIDELVHGLL